MAVAGAVIAPNLVPAALTTTRAGGLPKYWFDAMLWLRDNTPQPFGSADDYYGRYGAENPPAAFSVMNACSWASVAAAGWATLVGLMAKADRSPSSSFPR